MLLADAAEVLVVLRLHELLARLPALAHQFLGVGFEVLELVELGVGAVGAGAGERVGVHGGVVAAGRLGVALGRRAVVVPPHLVHPHRLVHRGQVRVAPARPRHVDRSTSPHKRAGRCYCCRSVLVVCIARLWPWPRSLAVVLIARAVPVVVEEAESAVLLCRARRWPAPAARCL